MIANEIFHVSVLLLIYSINLWHMKFVTADVTAVFENNQHGSLFSDEDKILKSLYVKGYTAKLRG